MRSKELLRNLAALLTVSVSSFYYGLTTANNRIRILEQKYESLIHKKKDSTSTHTSIINKTQEDPQCACEHINITIDNVLNVNANETINATVNLPVNNEYDDDPLGLEQLFDQKRESLRSNPNSANDCFCPNGRKNWIHFTGCPGSIDSNAGAGIKDRENILRNLFWYADELCANIALMCTPEVWLSEKHGCYAPRNATWDAYFTPVRQISMNAMNRTDAMLVSRKVDILHWDVNESTFEGMKRIDEKPSIHAYEVGRKLHSEGTPFVWNFDRDFWGTDLYTPKHIWPNQILNHRKYTDSCGILDFDTSEELLNVAQLLLQELDIKHSQDFVTLHLRRGDYKKCDTSPATVVKYLKCSMEKDDVKKVVVLTNGEENYVNNLVRVFSKKFPNKEMIILDQVVESRSFIEKLNTKKILSAHFGDAFLNDNCFRFSAEKVIASMSRYHLERGHAHCSSCDRGGSVNTGGTSLIRV